MKNVAIKVEGLSKCYRIGLPPKESNWKIPVLGKLGGSFRYLASSIRRPSEDETIWALKDVSFEIEVGEVVGIIGRNGAGKSTLLKILSRITEPSEGKALLRGRVGSLLEVGTGFHPELTGRENIYLNGAFLGMRRAEIDEKFEEIVAFSGIKKFLDTPVKRYSSGMGVRLAFSVAAHLRPEILLVDEVLAVGDAAFQKKCLGKMGDVAAEGRTVLFVSHNMVAVQSLCRRVIWLDQGQLVDEGPSAEIIRKYLKVESPGVREQVWPNPGTGPGNPAVRLRRLAVIPETVDSNDPIALETPFALEVEFENFDSGVFLDVRFFLKTDHGIVALGADTTRERNWHGRQFPAGVFRTRCRIPGNWLNSGRYSVTVEILKDGRRRILTVDGALTFDIIEAGERGGARFEQRPGILWPLLDWKTDLVPSESGGNLAAAGRSSSQFE